MKTKERKAVLNISLPIYQVTYLDQLASESGLSISAFIKEWIDNAMEINGDMSVEIEPLPKEKIGKMLNR